MKSQYPKRLLSNLINYRIVQALLRMTVEGYHFHNGWIDSVKAKRPVDKKGNPLPWLTYPFIDFISERLTPNLTLFEFGAGNSTLYFAPKIKSVRSVENNQEWFSTLNKIIPSNTHVQLETDIASGAYAKCITKLDESFDLILVDGRDRVNCCKQAIHKLSEIGVLILDNSERKEYQEAFSFFEENKFKHINFWGIAPGYIDRSCTTVFYKPQNCLGI